MSITAPSRPQCSKTHWRHTHNSLVSRRMQAIRLPDEATLDARVQSGTATSGLLREVAERVASFHAASQTDERIASFGQLDVIAGTWRENFAQMRPYIGRSLDQETYDRIEG
jgi:uncharacterized protein